MQMNWLRLMPALLLSLAACKGFPLFWKKAEQPMDAERLGDVQGDQSSARARLELQDFHYDGEFFSGRVLIGAEAGVLRLDKRLIPRSDVHVNSVLECGSGAPVAFIVADVIPPQARQEDLLMLTPGYWYGTTARFKLFSERFTGLGPECIEAELTVFSFEGKPVASARVRAVRELQHGSDGGMPGDVPPSADGGVP